MFRTGLRLTGLRRAVLAVSGRIAVLAVLSTSLAAAVPVAQRGVDLVGRTDGSRLLGLIANESRRDGILILVERSWLTQNFPDEAAAFAKQEARLAAESRERAKRRLSDWRKLHPGSKQWQSFVESLVQSSGEAKPRRSASRFVPIHVAADNVRRRYRQPESRRQVALQAWAAGLEDVSERSAEDLWAELRKRPVPAADPPEQDGLATLQDFRQPDQRQWATWRGIAEFTYHQGLHLQGSGGALLNPADEPGPAELLQFAQKLYTSQLQDLLNDLEPGRAARRPDRTDAWNKATRQADSQGLHAVRVTQVEPRGAGGRVQVASTFGVKLDSGQWQPVWHEQIAAAPGGDRESRDALRKDPRIARVLEAAEKLGAGANLVDQVLDVGAATQRAVQEIDQKFIGFRDRQLQTLEQGR